MSTAWGEGDFDDDIADEKYIAALEQVTSLSQNQYLPRETAQTGTGVTECSAFTRWQSSQASDNQVQRGSARAGSGHDLHAICHQTTLWSSDFVQPSSELSQKSNTKAYRMDSLREKPTHHELDPEALKTWTYPTNLGPLRDYQFSIVKNSLFNNTLVALPTGLGKTFIAATVMLNFYRWTKSAKIIFVVPTKPLVAQQVDACYHVAGIPRSDTTLLTGNIPPASRVDEWESKRVFFMTPQTLLNDISHGYADPKTIALIVIDEAHRAVGEYAYAKVAKLIRRFSESFRVLALTATPGSKIETVQEVIDNLGISHCEIRTEDSIDIRQYVHQRNVDLVILDPSDEMNLVSELFTAALKPLTDKLSSQNIFYGRNPMTLTLYGLMQSQKEWFATRGRQANQGVQFMMRAVFSVLTGIAHSIKLLQFHGIKPFFANLQDFRNEQEGKGEKGSKYKRQLIEDPNFQEMMNKIASWLKMDGFVGHPKLVTLTERIMNHFIDREKDAATRVIVFSEYRDSAEEIVRMLDQHRPLVRASVFVGQADSKRAGGMKQAQQIQTIEKFKQGDFNVLVATSIGEEGLDIGQVNLIICYDASASPIRMLQRMGRTGRKRAGNIVMLLMRGKEEEQFARSKDSYGKMQALICEGSRFNFRFDLSTRIVPRTCQPVVDKQQIQIPIENTQDSTLPEPKIKRVGAKKLPPKKFHMPDGVETGFRKVTHFMKPVGKGRHTEATSDKEMDELTSIPDIDHVTLSQAHQDELDKTYRDLPFIHSAIQEIEMPSLATHAKAQRQLLPVGKIAHGSCTKRFVKVFSIMGSGPAASEEPSGDASKWHFLDIPVKPFVNNGEDEKDATLLREVHYPEQLMDRRYRPSQTAAGDQREKKMTVSGLAHISKHGNTEMLSDQPSEKRKAERSTLYERSKKRSRQEGSKASHEASADQSSGEGRHVNGCDQDNDLQSGDSENEGSLLDFIAADSETVSSIEGSQSLPDSPDGSLERQAAGRFYVPTCFTATQESDDFPELPTLLGKRKGQKLEALQIASAKGHDGSASS